MTVSLDLDGQHYSGKTVWELSLYATPELLPGVPPKFATKGEAIEIPMADGRTLFVLRRSRTNPPSRGYGWEYIKCLPGQNVRELAAALPSFSGSCDPDLRPRLVIADQNGVLEVVAYDRHNAADPRVRGMQTIASSTLARRGDGIVQRHPWIAELPSGEQGGTSDRLYYEDFIRR